MRKVDIKIPEGIAGDGEAASKDHEADAADDAADVPEEREPNPQEPELRRSTRVRRPNPRYLSSLDYFLLTDSGEPEDYHEAVESSDAVK